MKKIVNQKAVSEKSQIIRKREIANKPDRLIVRMEEIFSLVVCLGCCNLYYISWRSIVFTMVR